MHWISITLLMWLAGGGGGRSAEGLLVVALGQLLLPLLVWLHEDFLEIASVFQLLISVRCYCNPSC
jgi:hypothetical protein